MSRKSGLGTSYYAVQRWGLRCHWELSQIRDSERAFKINGFFDRLCLIILGGETERMSLHSPLPSSFSNRAFS